MLRNIKQNLKILSELFASRIVIICSIIALTSCSAQENPPFNQGQPTPGTPASDDAFKPSPIIEVVHVQAFRVETEYVHTWRSENPRMNSGQLVVIKVDPKLVAPRNALEPVLYAGNQTVQRLNHGHESGFVIGIIPGEIELSRAPIWFGRPDLPERVNSETVANERALADRSGIKALSIDELAGVTRDQIQSPDMASLLREHASGLVLEFSPQEKHLADAWRLPSTNP